MTNVVLRITSQVIILLLIQDFLKRPIKLRRVNFLLWGYKIIKVT